MTLDPTGIITYSTVDNFSLVGSAIEYKVRASLELYPDVDATEQTFTVSITDTCSSDLDSDFPLDPFQEENREIYLNSGP